MKIFLNLESGEKIAVSSPSELKSAWDAMDRGTTIVSAVRDTGLAIPLPMIRSAILHPDVAEFVFAGKEE